MKKTLLVGLATLALVISLSPAAQADAFLNINGTSCNNSTAGGVTTCIANGFATSLGSNTITFTGTIGNFTIGNLSLTSNSPGTAALGTANDTKLQIQNNSTAQQQLVITFAENNYSLPVSPDILSASQSVTLATGTTTQAFTGFADSGNTLTPGAGTAAATPNCGPISGTSVSCNSDSAKVGFTHGAQFALSGSETITLSAGGISNYTGTVNLTPVIPEPSSLILLGSGMILLASRRFRRAK
jgi:hypothetical protein